MKMVSNIHYGTSDESVLRARKKPRVNQHNRATRNAIWKEGPVASVEIPQIINDYNYWMLGCNLCDQMIAYYRPKVRCRRTWMPLMFHCLDVLRVNLYILYEQTSLADSRVDDRKILDHKAFTKTLIHCLIGRANTEKRTESGENHELVVEVSPDAIIQRDHRPPLDGNNPSLTIYDHWLKTCTQVHPVNGPKGGSWCRYCSYKYLLDRRRGENALGLKQKRTRLWCSHCQVNLHRECFAAFHNN